MEQHNVIGMAMAVYSALAREAAFSRSIRGQACSHKHVVPKCRPKGEQMRQESTRKTGPEPGAFQEVLKPMINRTMEYATPEEGSSGKASSSTAASGIAEPALICDKTILPELGKCLARKSPIFPPKSEPIDDATENKVMRTLVPS
ncbi:hypothetical protein ACMD2_22841 [Ananas comosus]|uniref:Uncharacterized protein n=1 Tax=Ananas comosus TaxID=4615 RepID=A0A199V1A3_ANACO|nr:hypothetical protein ACMD2_22841 [Ananas comosus]